MWPLDHDVLDPRSRHNRHVTGPEDIPEVETWSRETLFAAVERADDAGDSADGVGNPGHDTGDSVVVLDYGRERIYLAPGAGLTYHPPVRLGFAAPPSLEVAEPRRFDPEDGSVTQIDPVAVSPEFDILVPAFDWEVIEEDDALPPIDLRGSRSPSGAGTGTPG